MRKLLPGLLALTTVVALVMWQRAERRVDAALARVAQLERARGGVASAGTAAPVAEAPVVPATPGERIVRVPAGVAPEQYVRVVDNKAIDELNAVVSDLRQQLAAATEESQKLTAAVAAKAEEQGRHAAQVEELKEGLRQAKNTETSLQAELQIKADRTAASEVAQKALTERVAKAEAATTKAAAVGHEVEDLNRRRETQIADIQRRYREANDVYRAFLLNEQNREHAAAGNQAGDLSRVQNSIQQAEDDLRQIRALNARIAALIH